jgi:uncharacterized protein
LRIRSFFFLLTVLALLGFGRIDFASETTFLSELPSETQGRFAVPDFLVVSVPEDNDVTEWDNVAETTSQLEGLDGVNTVISPATTVDLVASSETLDWVRLTPEAAAGTPVWRRLFGGHTHSHPEAKTDRWWLVYVQSDRIAPLRQWEQIRNDVFISGEAFYNDLLVEETRSDFLLVVPAGALLILVSYLLLVGQPTTAVRLWIVSIIPAIWVLGLFGWMRLSLSWWTMIVPLQAIALGTSYGLHVLHYRTTPFMTNPGRAGTALPPSYRLQAKQVRPIVLRASLTTALGFATMITSSVLELRWTGALVVIGVGFSVLSALVLLPVLGRDEVVSPPYRASSSVNGGKFASRGVLLGFVMVAMVAALGTTRIVPGSFIDTLFNRRSEAYRHILHAATTHGLVDTTEVVIDTGSPYGYANPELYGVIADFEERLVGAPGVNAVLGPTVLVAHAFGRLTGYDDPRWPETGADIGETLELLRSSNDRTGVSQLVSTDYRYVRMVVHYGSLQDTPSLRRSTVDHLEALVREFDRAIRDESGGSARAAGDAHARRVSLERDTRQYAGSVFFFVPVVFLVLLLLDRTVQRAALVVLPVVFGALVYGGVQGLIGLPFRFASILGLAFVLGVGADDAIYVVQSGLTHGVVPAHARKAVVQTTIIMLAGLSPAFFSRFRALQEMVLLMSLGLTASTLFSLFVLPRLQILVRDSRD